MTNRNSIFERWWTAGFITVIGAGLITGLVWHFQGNEAAKLIGALSILLSLSVTTLSNLINAKIEEIYRYFEEKQVALIGEALAQDSSLENWKELISLSAQITEEDFVLERELIFKDTRNKLLHLVKGDAFLNDEIRFFDWLIKKLNALQKGEIVIGFALQKPQRWISNPTDKYYLEANINAVKRGVKVQRIFIRTTEEFPIEKWLEAIEPQRENGIEIYFVDMPNKKIKELIGISGVFLTENDILLEVSETPAKARISKDRELIESYKKIYEKLRKKSRKIK